MMKNRALSGQLFANAGYFISRICLAMIIRFSSPAKEKEGKGFHVVLHLGFLRLSTFLFGMGGSSFRRLRGEEAQRAVVEDSQGVFEGKEAALAQRLAALQKTSVDSGPAQEFLAA